MFASTEDFAMYVILGIVAFIGLIFISNLPDRPHTKWDIFEEFDL